jgi:hypothetical protein
LTRELDAEKRKKDGNEQESKRETGGKRRVEDSTERKQEERHRGVGNGGRIRRKKWR